MNPIIKSNAIKFGSWFGLVNLAYVLYAYLIDKTIFTATAPGIVIFIAGIVFYIIAVGKVKQAQDGYATFREVFTTYIVAGVVATLIGTGFGILLFVVIDPEFASEVLDLIVEVTVERLENAGMSDEQMTPIIDRIVGSNPFSVGGQLKSAAFGIVFNAIVGLIVAAAMKKNNPELEA